MVAQAELKVITQAELKETLSYNIETGDLIWIISKPGVKVGSVAGTPALGYVSITINRRLYRAHRLIWLYMTGEWPKDQIDHINHIRNDNRWCNLREATYQENQRNRTNPKNNKSGVCGVRWREKRNRWSSQIKVNRKAKHLGSFTDKFEAICARKSAENKYGFHENHGAARV